MKRIILPLIIAIIILVIIGGFCYYKQYYSYSGNAPAITQEELSCGAYYGDYNQKKTGTPDNWTNIGKGTKSSVWSAPGNNKDPLDCHKEPPLIGGCAGVSADNLQECCERWANDNQMMRVQCMGEWKIKENKCAYECGGGIV
jgi:uncharacterized protein YxeA